MYRRGLQVGSPSRTCTLNRQIVEKYPKFLYNGLEPNAPPISLSSARSIYIIMRPLVYGRVRQEEYLRNLLGRLSLDLSLQLSINLTLLYQRVQDVQN